MKSLKTFEEVADFYGLNEEQKKMYVAYMIRRWGDEEELLCETGYACEWADKFRVGIEYQTSDDAGKQVLKELSNKYKEEV